MRALANIEALDLYPVAASPKSTWLLLRVAFADGLAGYGEATRYGAEEAVVAEIEAARRLLVGKNLAAPGEALTALRMAQASEARRTVSNALEQAFIDAMARRAGLPAHRLLGGPCRDRASCYANINRGISDRSPDGFARRAREVVETDGYRAIKIAPFDGLDWRRADPAAAGSLLAAGVDRILAVRGAIGRDVALLVDCHWRLSPMMARTVLREVAAADLFWLEDALDDDAFDAAAQRALRGFANDRGVRIAGGERLINMAQAREFCARGGHDVALPDLRSTGVRAGMAMLELASASGIDASLHNPAGPVLDGISAQVAAALPSFLILEGQVRESALFGEIAGGERRLDQGARVIGDGSGIGFQPDMAVLRQFLNRRASQRDSLAGVTGAGPDG